MEYLIILIAYTWPLFVGLFAVWFLRTFVLKEDSYVRDWTSGLIMFYASRELFKNFRGRRKRY